MLRFRWLCLGLLGAAAVGTQKSPAAEKEKDAPPIVVTTTEETQPPVSVPTDEAFGKKQGGGWQMPNPRVNQALLERTAGRILRNDRRYTKSADLEPFGKLAGKDRLTDDILYLEYRVL